MSKMITDCVEKKAVEVTNEDLLDTFSIELPADFSPLFDYVDYVVESYKGFEDFEGNQKYCYVEVLSTAICYPNIMAFYDEDEKTGECSLWTPFDALCSAYWEAHELHLKVEDWQEYYDISYDEAEEMLTYRRAVAEEIFKHAERFHNKMWFSDIREELVGIAMAIMATRD